MKEILSIEDLEVNFHSHAGKVQAVRGVSLAVQEGEALAIVGESGCGKTATMQSVLRLIPMPPGEIASGRILFEDKDLVSIQNKQMRSIRGNKIGMIFQDPMTSLNPTMRVGKQIMEGMIHHKGFAVGQAHQEALKLMRFVGIPYAEKRMEEYPYQFSGGMRQRVMIAIALSCSPKLLIADEPTTALDVTIQVQILQLLQKLKKEMGMSIILITHDLGIVARLCDRVAVMYAGKIVEQGSVDDIFYQAKHPYTKGLLKSLPQMKNKGKRLEAILGTPPDLFSPPEGCCFSPRCPYAMKICQRDRPLHLCFKNRQKVNCHLYDPRAIKMLRKYEEDPFVQ